MRCNNVIVCQDYRPLTLTDVAELKLLDQIPFDELVREKIREDVNRDLALIQYLRNLNYRVRLFDGYEMDLVRKIKDPSRGGQALGKLITDFGADGLVYDLNYFGDFTYGLEMLKVLLSMNLIQKLNRIVIVSYFIDERPYDYRSKLVSEFSIDPNCIKYALKCTYSDIDKLLSI